MKSSIKIFMWKPPEPGIVKPYTLKDLENDINKYLSDKVVDVIKVIPKEGTYGQGFVVFVAAHEEVSSDG